MNDASAISSRRGWAITIVAACGIAIAFLDRQTMSVLAPIVTRDLEISETQYGLLASGFALAMLCGSSVTGWWIARLGARRAFLVAVLVWSGVAALHSLAAGFVSLLLLRTALGFTESPSLPAALETVERVLPVASRPRATGLLFAGSSMGVLVAAPIAVALQQSFGWRVAFVTAAVFAALVWVPAWCWLTSPAAGVAMGGHAERQERRGLAKNLAVLAHPATLRAVAVVAGVMPLITFTTAWEAKWLVHDFGLHPSKLGHYLILGPLLFDVGALAFGDLASRRLLRRPDGTAPRLLFAIAAALVVGGDLAAAFAPTALAAIGCNGIAAVGRGAIFPLVVADLARRLPPALVPAGSSAINGMQALSMVVASPIIGYVIQGYGYRAILVALSLWAVVPFLSWLVNAPPIVATAPEPRAAATRLIEAQNVVNPPTRELLVDSEHDVPQPSHEVHRAHL